MSAIVTLQFVVSIGYADGDYVVLHGNGGSGEIDWETPLSTHQYDLFPDGAGIYGFGLAPFGRHRFGRAQSRSSPGFGRLPFGRHPFGLGTSVITITHKVDYCGDYKFALACYDAAGNLHEGSPVELDVPIHIAPPAPTGLVKHSYDKDTDILMLDAA